MGGDKDHKYLFNLLQYIKSKNLKTAFYSGFDFLDMHLIEYLDYYKIGRFILPEGDVNDWHKKSCGPINFPWSNQKLFKVIHIDDTYNLLDITDEFRKDPLGDLNRYVLKNNMEENE